MRRLRLIIVFLLFVAASVYLFLQFQKGKSTLILKKIQETRIVPKRETETSLKDISLFVPSWTLDGPLPQDKYTRFIYFGVTGGTDGIQTEDEGYKNLSKFVSVVPQQTEKLLTVKMTNSSVNFSVLKSEEGQKKIIDDAVKLASDNGFDGIVLDFELQSFFDEKVPGDINSFVERFYNEVKKNNLSFALTIYGDVFYRKRPFDVPFLGNHSDEIMIMAYDYHKSIGEPGPNFPLSGKERFDYDFQTMIKEYSERVSPKKLTVLFGMYGYDWVVDEKKRSIRPAKALSLNEIRKTYLDTCGKTNCVPFRDKDAKENELDYVDNGALYHIVWFEDEESAKQKTEFLQKNGVGSIGYWAHGHF